MQLSPHSGQIIMSCKHTLLNVGCTIHQKHGSDHWLWVQKRGKKEGDRVHILYDCLNNNKHSLDQFLLHGEYKIIQVLWMWEKDALHWSQQLDQHLGKHLSLSFYLLLVLSLFIFDSKFKAYMINIWNQVAASRSLSSNLFHM